MQRVGIKNLKNHLSEYVRAAAAGQTVLVTDRGRVVAELIPPRVSPGAPDDEQRLGELVQLGLLSPAKTGPSQRPPPRRPVTTLDELLRDLDDSRASR